MSRCKVALGVLWVALALAVLGLAACSSADPWARDDSRMRGILSEDYPRFHVTKLDYHDAGPLTFPAPRLVYYQFTLESDDVPGFVVYGVHNLADVKGSRPWGPSGSLFDGSKLSEEQLAELERQWVRRFPGSEVQIGDGSTTGGPVDLVRLRAEGAAIASRYEGAALSEVYRISGTHPDREVDSGDYFSLDRRTGRWEYLEGFIEPNW